MQFLAACLLIVATTSAAPVNEVVDLSYVYDDNVMYFPAPSHPKFQLEPVGNGIIEVAGRKIKNLKICSAEHGGTHIDAPSHFADGKWELDEIPLDRLIRRPLVVINITERALSNSNATVDVKDLEDWEKQYGQIPEGAVVIMKSGWNRYWGNKTAYLGNDKENAAELIFPGFSAASAEWLVKRKIAGVGSDTVSFDIGATTDYPVHKILLNANIYGLENVANTDKLPSAGGIISIFPMKITSGTGAPSRVIAEMPRNKE